MSSTPKLAALSGCPQLRNICQLKFDWQLSIGMFYILDPRKEEGGGGATYSGTVILQRTIHYSHSLRTTRSQNLGPVSWRPKTVKSRL